MMNNNLYVIISIENTMSHTVALVNLFLHEHFKMIIICKNYDNSVDIVVGRHKYINAFATLTIPFQILWVYFIL